MTTSFGTDTQRDRAAVVHCGDCQNVIVFSEEFYREISKAKEFYADDRSMNQGRTLRSVIDEGLDKHAALFVPGGQPPIVDLVQDAEVGEICGTSTRKIDRLTFVASPHCYRRGDAQGVGMHAKLFFSMPAAFGTAGAIVSTTPGDFDPNVVEDRELITGQNPR